MEVEVLDVQGLPPDSFIRVRAGQQQRQAKISAGAPFIFPMLPAGTKPLRVEVLQHLCGKSVALSPDANLYCVRLPGGEHLGGSFAPSRLRLSVRDVAPEEAAREAAEGPAAAAAVAAEAAAAETAAAEAAAEAEEAVEAATAAAAGGRPLPREQRQQQQRQQRPQPGPAAAERREARAAQARGYLREHDVLGFVQEVLSTLIHVRPEDPYAYMGFRAREWRSKERMATADSASRGQTEEGEAKELEAPSAEPPPGPLPGPPGEEAAPPGREPTEAGLKELPAQDTPAEMLTADLVEQVKQNGGGLSDERGAHLEAVDVLLREEMLARDQPSEPQALRSSSPGSSASLGDLRVKLLGTLSTAAETGLLDRVIDDITLDRGEMQEAAQAPGQLPRPPEPSSKRGSLEELRARLLDTLADAADSGLLDSAMQDITAACSSQLAVDPPAESQLVPTDAGDFEGLRSKLLSTLTQAMETGLLHEALRLVHGSESPQSANDARTTPTLHGSLTEALVSGMLEEAIQDLAVGDTGISGHASKGDSVGCGETVQGLKPSADRPMLASSAELPGACGSTADPSRRADDGSHDSSATREVSGSVSSRSEMANEIDRLISASISAGAEAGRPDCANSSVGGGGACAGRAARREASSLDKTASRVSSDPCVVNEIGRLLCESPSSGRGSTLSARALSASASPESNIAHDLCYLISSAVAVDGDLGQSVSSDAAVASEGASSRLPRGLVRGPSDHSAESGEAVREFAASASAESDLVGDVCLQVLSASMAAMALESRERDGEATRATSSFRSRARAALAEARADGRLDLALANTFMRREQTEELEAGRPGDACELGGGRCGAARTSDCDGRASSVATASDLGPDVTRQIFEESFDKQAEAHESIPSDAQQGPCDRDERAYSVATASDVGHDVSKQLLQESLEARAETHKSIPSEEAAVFSDGASPQVPKTLVKLPSQYSVGSSGMIREVSASLKSPESDLARDVFAQVASAGADAIASQTRRGDNEVVTAEWFLQQQARNSLAQAFSDDRLEPALAKAMRQHGQQEQEESRQEAELEVHSSNPRRAAVAFSEDPNRGPSPESAGTSAGFREVLVSPSPESDAAQDQLAQAVSVAAGGVTSQAREGDGQRPQTRRVLGGQGLDTPRNCIRDERAAPAAQAWDLEACGVLGASEVVSVAAEGVTSQAHEGDGQRPQTRRVLGGQGLDAARDCVRDEQASRALHLDLPSSAASLASDIALDVSAQIVAAGAADAAAAAEAAAAAAPSLRRRARGALAGALADGRLQRALARASARQDDLPEEAGRPGAVRETEEEAKAAAPPQQPQPALVPSLPPASAKRAAKPFKGRAANLLKAGLKSGEVGKLMDELDGAPAAPREAGDPNLAPTAEAVEVPPLDFDSALEVAIGMLYKEASAGAEAGGAGDDAGAAEGLSAQLELDFDLALEGAVGKIYTELHEKNRNLRACYAALASEYAALVKERNGMHETLRVLITMGSVTTNVRLVVAPLLKAPTHTGCLETENQKLERVLGELTKANSKIREENEGLRSEIVRSRTSTPAFDAAPAP